MRIKIVVAVLASVALVTGVAACSSSDDGSTSSTSAMSPAMSSVAGASSSTPEMTAPTPSSVAPGTPSATLASTPWETTSATDQHGMKLALTDKNVANYVGFAYFKPDGTFTMFTLDDKPKMHGVWSVSADGKTRTITSLNDAGKVAFTRQSPIVTLTDKEFVYRTFPDPANKSVYVDIVHTPTKHQAPQG
ncbi:DUF4822 domain-containing protein [Gordonia sp. TBRC 11910]|uniref:DUF4822 domain-containing protein n=1 Tax=Gordonia asplenii TaxID=2725283 RepID=A0A848KPI2_9ACTN|nr:DUF4822 domain-containing protein [Gordonia asplenii]NMO00230.1 DUF4822 domain-containing protein [Gordonia asplenii]